jgi:hypothetical protein
MQSVLLTCFALNNAKATGIGTAFKFGYLGCAFKLCLKLKR